MPFETLVRLLRNNGSVKPDESDPANPVAIATAGVLLELAHADQHFSEREQAQLLETMTATFGLTSEQAARILDKANEARGTTIDHWAFTSRIRESTDRDTRIEIVKAMWRLVFADGRLHDYEEYLVRKLSDLLGVQHHEMIEAKVTVRKAIGQGPEAKAGE
ncbi:MAG: TerB family tellurite resistance protein [Acidobacteria bacterium]|nr:TerB family tellurite resistance protein [Acidobacteriota bacterium]